MTTHHVHISLRMLHHYIEDYGNSAVLQDDEGETLTRDEALETINAWRRAGQQYVTARSCDNVSSNGRCQGHEREA